MADISVEGGLPLWVVITVVLVALLVGISAIGVVIRKYFADNWFHAIGGPVLTGAGVILIGLSVYGNVTLKVGEFEADFKRARAEVTTLRTSLRDSQFVIQNLAGYLKSASTDLTDIVHAAKSPMTGATNVELRALLANVRKKVVTLNDRILPVAAFRKIPARPPGTAR